MGILPTVDASSMERQAIKMVEQLVTKFEHLEAQFKSKTMKDMIAYYQEFNSDSQALPLLAYLA